MKLRLRNIQFKGFRSLTDCRLNVDSAVTTIVGENETGKTNVLIAIDKFNIGKKFDSLIDRRQHSDTDPTLILTFDILGKKEDLLDVLGSKQDERTKTLIIEKQGDRYLVNSPKLDVKKSKFYIEAVNKYENEVDNDEKSDQNNPIQDSSNENAVNKEKINNDDNLVKEINIDEDKIRKEIIDWVISKIDIKYFKGRDTTELIQGEVSLKNLINNPKKYSHIIKLLSIGGLEPHTFPTSPAQKHILKKASSDITKRINRFWKQEGIEVELSFSSPNIIVKVKDGKIEGDVWLSPQQRSDGFQWYFAFFIHFLGELEKKNTDTILLLDEPGIFLHADGQKDLLELLEEIAKKSNQIIFTTHSPYMIHRDYIDRVRFIQKKRKGSVIDNSAWSRGGQGILPEPIRATIGMLLSDSLL